jgi:predicted Zn-dependent protease
MKYKRYGIVVLLLCILTTFIIACTTVPYTERRQLILFSESQEVALGNASFSQVLKEGKASSDSHHNELVQRAGKRIAQAASRSDYQWEFVVLDDPKTVNAFALPGGKVAFYSGILPVCQDENGVAVVMGHEVAHALARHGAERMSHDLLAELGSKGLSIALADKTPAAQNILLKAYGLGVTYGIERPFSREQESEADHIGLILMAKAGYDPGEAIGFWQRMDSQSKGNKMPEFLSTHPSHEHRIRQIKEWLPEVNQYYKKP